MDPNVAYKEMIEWANAILLEDDAHDKYYDEKLAARVLDLDEWIRREGFLPDAWSKPRHAKVRKTKTAYSDKPLNWWSREELQEYLEDNGFAVYDDEPEEDLLEAVRLEMEQNGDIDRYAKVRKTAISIRDLDDFTLGYLEAALWASTDESDESGGLPLDRNYGIEDIADECLQAAIADCQRFQEQNYELLGEADYSRSEYSDDEMAGHDFFLTRNGHGVGYWDREFSDDTVGDALTKAAEAFSEVDFYVGDDGLIYCQ